MNTDTYETLQTVMQERTPPPPVIDKCSGRMPRARKAHLHDHRRNSGPRFATMAPKSVVVQDGAFPSSTEAKSIES